MVKGKRGERRCKNQATKGDFCAVHSGKRSRSRSRRQYRKRSRSNSRQYKKQYGRGYSNGYGLWGGAEADEIASAAESFPTDRSLLLAIEQLQQKMLDICRMRVDDRNDYERIRQANKEAAQLVDKVLSVYNASEEKRRMLEGNLVNIKQELSKIEAKRENLPSETEIKSNFAEMMAQMEERHKAEMAALKAQLDEALGARASGLDQITADLRKIENAQKRAEAALESINEGLEHGTWTLKTSLEKARQKESLAKGIDQVESKYYSDLNPNSPEFTPQAKSQA